MLGDNVVVVGTVYWLGNTIVQTQPRVAAGWVHAIVATGRASDSVWTITDNVSTVE